MCDIRKASYDAGAYARAVKTAITAFKQDLSRDAIHEFVGDILTSEEIKQIENLYLTYSLDEILARLESYI